MTSLPPPPVLQMLRPHSNLGKTGYTRHRAYIETGTLFNTGERHKKLIKFRLLKMAHYGEGEGASDV